MPTRPPSAGMTAARAKRARTLYDDGHGCNAIARTIGVAPATVSKWAKDEQLPFDRRQTSLAVRAHVIDLRADALLGAQKALVAAHTMIDRLDGIYVVAELGRGSGEAAGDVWIEHEFDEPPVEIVRNAVVTMGIAVDKALKVTAAFSDDRTVAGESLIDSLITGFAKQAATYTPPAV